MAYNDFSTAYRVYIFVVSINKPEKSSLSTVRSLKTIKSRLIEIDRYINKHKCIYVRLLFRGDAEMTVN